MNFNPNNINSVYKKAYIHQNVFASKIGMYKSVPKFPCRKTEFAPKYKPGPISQICDVKVINQNHIDILGNLLDKGVNHLVEKDKPLVMQSIGEEFNGSNLESGEGVRDSLFILRTNFAAAFKNNDPFPLRNTQCAYIPLVTVLRNKMYQPLPYNDLYSYSMVIACPVRQPELIDEDRMVLKDYTETLNRIQTVFQIAIACGHRVLILTPFGLEDADSVPIEDTIKIFNFCIYRYGHKFKNIIMSVPEYYPKSVYQMYDDNLVKPQLITKSIDEKYESKQFQAKLLSR